LTSVFRSKIQIEIVASIRYLNHSPMDWLMPAHRKTSALRYWATRIETRLGYTYSRVHKIWSELYGVPPERYLRRCLRGGENLPDAYRRQNMEAAPE